MPSVCRGRTYENVLSLLALIRKNHYNITIMDELTRLLQENLNKEFVSAVLSAPRDKNGVSKVKVRPLLKRGELIFQLESFRSNQAFHENLNMDEARERIM